MAFCPNCGTEATGAFCPNCGTAIGGAAGTSAGTGPGAGSTAGAAGYVNPPAAGGLNANIVAALCYLLGIIGGIIFLLIEPYSKDRNIRFHAFQSILLTLAWIVIGIVIGIIAHGFALLLWPLYEIFFLVIWIYMIITAYQGKKVVLPVIGELAQKQA